MWSLIFICICYLTGYITYLFLFSNTEYLSYIEQAHHKADATLSNVLDTTPKSHVLQYELLHLKEQNTVLDSMCISSITDDIILKYITYQDYYFQLIQGTKQIQSIESIHSFLECYAQIEMLVCHI